MTYKVHGDREDLNPWTLAYACTQRQHKRKESLKIMNKAISKASGFKKPLGIYIHIPFCISKCSYCDFLSGPSDEVTINTYMDALVKEIEGNRNLGSRFFVDTVFFGGGTPSIAAPLKIKAVMEKLKEVFEFDESPEVTIEANPGTITEKKLMIYREAGINRISMGLQSTENEELKLLGRIHTYEEFLEGYRMAEKCGFSNINVDLMSALPGQTPESWAKTLERIADLDPAHISAYSLIIEEGTPFYEWFQDKGGRNCPPLPSEEEERGMYELTKRFLEARGYCQYEISNYAKEGFICRHNMGYWRRKDYLGIGTGAASLIDNVRFSNTESIPEYIENCGSPDSIHKATQNLSVQEQMEEFMFLGLRTTEGIDKEEFDRVFSGKFEAVYGKICEKLEKEGMLKGYSRKPGRICLTGKGMDLSNYVLAQFLLD